MTELRTLLDSFVEWHLDAYPVRATLLGATGREDTLGDQSAAAWARRDAETRQWLDRFAAVDGAGLSLDDSVDRDLVVATLRGETILADEPEWRRDPAVYVGPILSGLFTLFLHRLRPEAELVASAVARLREVPGSLAACKANLDASIAPALVVRRALGQARSARAFLTSSLPGEVADEALRRGLVEAAEPAAAAFDELAVWLEEFAERAQGDWRLGEKRYSALLRERELLGYGATELHERGEAVYAELDTQMRELATKVPGGSEDWHAVMTALQADHPPTLEAMRAEYAAETERARQFLIDNDLVPFAEGEECRVVPSPGFQRPILSVAFYIAPPPLTSSRLGHFFVPFTPEEFTEEQVRQRLATNARAQMPTIAVHEAYPGHHWHLSWMAGGDRTVRKLFRTPYFSEGWALYAERLLSENGYFADPAHELAHLDARIFRAARIVVDTALHCGDMTIEQAERHMATKASLTPGTAVGEVNRYCAWPTQAPSYLTGSLEIEKIRADYLAAGRGDVRSFNAKIAGSGALPLGLARRIALES
ncbi:DUF885 domain-containing protein [Allokutzneria oryzae]|uniref:DUF885 domain-containing protein n=1 Tax=Allokutzneria oryzae TaxID=1378989 RepID=A0ABV5ZYU9_9PSEU